jgi:hypothetical protein
MVLRRVLQRVLDSAGPGEDVLVAGEVVSFAEHVDGAKLDAVVQVGLAFPLDGASVPAAVVALDGRRFVPRVGSGAADAGYLRDGADATGGGVVASLGGEDLEVG